MTSKERSPDDSRRRFFRKSDFAGIAGAAAVATGMLLFKSGADYVPAWIAWLVAPLLWYIGFAVLVVWAAVRMLPMARTSQRRGAEEGAGEPARPTPPPIVASIEFAEHDFFFDQVGRTTF
jgi:hypothetical protein